MLQIRNNKELNINDSNFHPEAMILGEQTAETNESNIAGEN